MLNAEDSKGPKTKYHGTRPQQVFLYLVLAIFLFVILLLAPGCTNNPSPTPTAPRSTVATNATKTVEVTRYAPPTSATMTSPTLTATNTSDPVGTTYERLSDQSLLVVFPDGHTVIRDLPRTAPSPSATTPSLTKTSTIPSPTPTSKPSLTTATTIAAFTPGSISGIDKANFSVIDQYVLSAPSGVSKSIDMLAAYLANPAKNDFDKARSVYRWITENISYDFSAYLSGSYGSTRAADVLVTGSSVCSGYSSLFEALARSTGLEVTTINGWAKGYSYSTGDQISGPTNHAWNAIKIRGGWYLIDSTWGAGHISQQKFVRDFDEFYFLSPPEQFIYNHFPEDQKWQLLSTPLSKSDFSALPYLYSDFFKYGVGVGTNTQAVMRAKGSIGTTFPTPTGTYLLARLWQGNVELAETYASATRSGSLYKISASFPSSGNYILRIYASKSEYSMYDCILEYKVVVSLP